MEFKFGLMEQNIKVSGGIIRLMEKVNFGTLMETYLKDNGSTIRQTVLVLIFMQMELNIKVIGRMMSSMDLVNNAGMTVLNMKVITS